MLLAVLALASLAACQPAGPKARDTLASDTRASDARAQHGATSAAGEPVAIGPTGGDIDVSGIVGKPAPGWNLAQWFNSPPLTMESLRGQVVLVRWFMSPNCPFCSATAPSLKAFHEQYAAAGCA